MVPRVPPDYEELRRKQILETAWDLIAEKGYQRLTMRELAGRMGVSTGVIYNYFRGKHEIITAMQEQSLQANASMFERLAGSGTWRHALREMLDEFSACCRTEEFIKYAKGNIGLIAEAMRDEDLGASVSLLYEHASDAMSKLAVTGRERGEFSSDVDPTTYTQFVMALFFGLQIQSVLLRDRGFTDRIEGMIGILLENIWRDPDSTRGDSLEESS